MCCEGLSQALTCKNIGIFAGGGLAATVSNTLFAPLISQVINTAPPRMSGYLLLAALRQ